MGSTIYSQKVKHPAYISFTCEHCGHFNSFSQEIVGNASAEVRFGSSNKRAQEKVSKLGMQAESDLERQIQNAKSNSDSGHYSWIKFHKCSKCNYTQSWQASRLWRKSIKYILLDLLYVFVFYSWLTGSSLASKTPGAWGGFAMFGILAAIPIIVLVLNLRKTDPKTQHKPEVSI